MVTGHSGEVIATENIRVVHGERGSYVEFSDGQMVMDNLHIPADQQWRQDAKYNYVFYDEWRTNTENVKVYHQRKSVGYADYQVGMWYVFVGDCSGWEDE